MPKRVFLLLMLMMMSLPAQAADNSHPMFHHSNLPVPRFVSLKSNEINVRIGPAMDYPIAWVYSRRNLPVEVVEEFGHWRHIRDHEDDMGWIHHSLLSGERYGYIIADALTPVYASAGGTGRIVLQLEPGVIAKINACQQQWCQVTARQYSGWISKEALWGVYDHEQWDD